MGCSLIGGLPLINILEYHHVTMLTNPPPRIGRKPSFILSYIGIVLAFAWGPLMLVIGPMPHVRLSVLGSVFFLIGGGIPVAMNSLNAMSSDISSEADR